MPFIASPDGHGTPDSKPTYSDVAKGLLHNPHQNEHLSIANIDPDGDEWLALSTKPRGQTGLPHTPTKEKNIDVPPRQPVSVSDSKRRYPAHPQDSPPECDPYAAANYHFPDFSQIHRDPYGHIPPITSVGKDLGRDVFHDQLPVAKTRLYNTAYVQRTPNPLQMTIDQRWGISNPQAWQDYGKDSHDTVQGEIDRIASGLETQNARKPAIVNQYSGTDLVKKYDVLMDQYTRRFYDCDFDQARRLPSAEVPKRLNRKEAET
ncbi:MAG: hypothetical protein Q9169_001676 [Polycauliona sp. 2 TL-2023]